MNDYRQHPANTRHWAGKAALTRIADAPLSDQQRFLLSECVTAYLPVSPAQGAELQRFLDIETTGRLKAMNVTTYDRGRAVGRQEGRQEGARFGRIQLLQSMLNLPVAGEDELAGLDESHLDQLERQLREQVQQQRYGGR